MPATITSILRISGIGTIVIAFLLTFVPHSRWGSIWTYQFGNAAAGGPGRFSSESFQGNATILVIAAVVAVVGTCLLLIARRIAAERRSS